MRVSQPCLLSETSCRVCSVILGYEELLCTDTEQNRSRKLLNCILPRKERGAYKKFRDVLLAEESQKYE
jgi:hypothetical protein